MAKEIILAAKTVSLRFVEEDDAAFILNLRLNNKYNRYLSAVSSNLQSQKRWIAKYKEDEKKGLQYYFIIQRNDGVPCGTVRIYDIRSDSFGWGSWILNENKTRYAALESAFLVYEFGFGQLGLTRAHFEVMKGNSKVISFHKRMGAMESGEDETNVYFEVNKETIISLQKSLSGKLV